MNMFVSTLALLFLFITAWEEESKRMAGKKILKSWRTMQYEVLKKLEERNLIRTSWNSLTLEVTEEGKVTAEKLKERLEPIIKELTDSLL